MSTVIAYLIRHGETDWNAQGLLQGHTDIPLNTNGFSQAHFLREQLAHESFTAAFSSDLSRASQTAEIVIHARPLSILETPILRERQAGKFEGQKCIEFERAIQPFLISPQAREKEVYLKTAWHPEIETATAVYQRVTQFLFTSAERFLGQTLLFSSHSGVLRTVLDHLSFTPGQRWVVANCGFLKLRITGQTLDLMEMSGVTQCDWC